MNPMKWVISTLAGVLLVVVGVGFALPGTWQATSSRTLPLAAVDVYPYLASVEGWSRWTPMPFVEGDVSGPFEGPGARLRWDDPQWGQGEWALTEADPPRSMSYEVAVEQGSLRTWGRVELADAPQGTRITWTERGDFGWNPLLSWMALGMERMQGSEMQKSLDELERVLSNRALDPVEAP